MPDPDWFLPIGWVDFRLIIELNADRTLIERIELEFSLTSRCRSEPQTTQMIIPSRKLHLWFLRISLLELVPISCS